MGEGGGMGELDEGYQTCLVLTLSFIAPDTRERT